MTTAIQYDPNWVRPKVLPPADKTNKDTQQVAIRLKALGLLVESNTHRRADGKISWRYNHTPAGKSFTPQFVKLADSDVISIGNICAQLAANIQPLFPDPLPYRVYHAGEEALVVRDADRAFEALNGRSGVPYDLVVAAMQDLVTDAGTLDVAKVKTWGEKKGTSTTLKVTVLALLLVAVGLGYTYRAKLSEMFAQMKGKMNSMRAS